MTNHDRDAEPDNGEFYELIPGIGICWRMRITPHLFGLLELQGTGKGRRYRRFYGVVVGNFQCGVWSWKIHQYEEEAP